MVANILGLVLINIGCILLFDFLAISIGFFIDLFQKDKEPTYVFFGVGIAVVGSVLFIIISIILWGILIIVL